jgi:hypothetical protein
VHNSLSRSNNPYSEPDADNSPNNDTDWDWGGGKASPCGSLGPHHDPEHQNTVILTKAALAVEDNAISEYNLIITQCLIPVHNSNPFKIRLKLRLPCSWIPHFVSEPTNSACLFLPSVYIPTR